MIASSRISIEDYRAFIAVVDEGSFVGAAEALHLTQSALSRRIAKIESHLDARLFDRDSRNVALTGVGRAFVPIARPAVAAFERSLHEITDVVALRDGTVTFASMLTAAQSVLPDVVADFAAAFPGVRIRLLDHQGDTVLDRVAGGEAEFALVVEPPEHPRLEFEPLWQDPYVLACPAAHALAGTGGPVRWADLAADPTPFIRVGPGNRNHDELAREDLSRAVLERARFEVQHVSTALAYVNAGVGITAVPAMVLREGMRESTGSTSAAGPQAGRIAAVPLDQPAVCRRIGLVRARHHHLSPAAAELSERVSLALRSSALPQA